MTPFYDLHIAGRKFTMAEDYALASQTEKNKWVICDSRVDEDYPYGRGELVSSKIDESFHCSVSSTHRTHRTYASAELDLFGVQATPFIDAEEILLLSEPFAEKLVETPFTGYELRVADIVYPDDIDFTIYFCRFTSPSPSLPTPLAEGETNRCANCGFGPIKCPECGHFESPCPVCQIRLDGTVRFDRSRDWLKYVDVTRWSGDDFFGDLFPTVTGRVVDWLVENKAFPFVAEPLFVDEAGLTVELKAKLRSVSRRDDKQE